MNVEVEINEGDVLVLNEKVWTVDEDPGGLDAGKLIMEPRVGELRIFDREKIEELIEYSGNVRLIRKDWHDVYEF